MRARAQIILLCLFLLIIIGCSPRPSTGPQAAVTPSVSLDRVAAGGGQMVDARYQFTVAADASPLPPDQTVFVHLLDEDGELLWAGDHRPATPSELWKPGQRIVYERPIAIPRGIGTSPLSLRIGLYGPTGSRLALRGDDAGDHSYRVATVEPLPPGREPQAVFSEGWHDVEIPDNTGVNEWHWSKERGIVRMRNPRRWSTLVLDLAQPVTSLPGPQQVEIRLGATMLDRFMLTPGQRDLRRVPIAAEALGTDDVLPFELAVEPTFVPAAVQAGNGDMRKLGVRVFYTYLTRSSAD
jgi:hypothetical protein